MSNLTLSVVVPTRNRPAQIVECVRSVLATDGYADLIVIDQSDDTATQDRLSAFDDARLRYVRTETRGATKGRNLGMSLSRSDIIAFTDDDCRVRPRWPRSITELFAADATAAVICGRVVVPDEIAQQGYAAGFEPQQRHWQGKYPSLAGDWGLTANLALRSSILKQVGVFDPMLGGGAPLRSGEEYDFLFRVLRAGMKVVNASEIVVDHYGVRKPGEETRNLLMGYTSGIAAAMFKHVRLGDRDGIILYLQFLGWTVARVSENIVRGRRPIGARYLAAYLSGTLASCRFGIDRDQREYIAR
jgi:glycosyltransferase involved in cell wall biosynthesis